MELFHFLCFSVIFCGLVMVVNSKGDRNNKVVPLILIGAETLLLLFAEGILDAPMGYGDTIPSWLSAVVAVAALIEFLRISEKSFALLALYAGLVQLLVALDILS